MNCARVVRAPSDAHLLLTPRTVTQRSLVVTPRPSSGLRHSTIRATKKDEDDSTIGTIMKASSSVVDKITEFIPETVPRSAAKLGVAAIGGIIVIALIQKVVSGIVTLAVVAGLGYFYFTRGSSGSSDTDSGSSNGSSSQGGSKDKDDGKMDDPLSEARNIMNKYK